MKIIINISMFLEMLNVYINNKKFSITVKFKLLWALMLL